MVRAYRCTDADSRAVDGADDGLAASMDRERHHSARVSVGTIDRNAALRDRRH
jgi:hypothetical protein